MDPMNPGHVARVNKAEAEFWKLSEREGIAAASPIEQRWTSRSTSPMSPAFSKDQNDIFSWVGVIMYTFDEKAPEIKDKFRSYAEKHADQTLKYGGAFHWAKIDLDFHKGPARLAELKKHYGQRFDLVEFRKLRKALDPKNLFGNKLTDTALSPP